MHLLPCVGCGGIFPGMIKVHHSSKVLVGSTLTVHFCGSHHEPMELLKEIMSLFKYFHAFLKMVAYIIWSTVCMIASTPSFQSGTSQDIYRSMQ